MIPTAVGLGLPSLLNPCDVDEDAFKAACRVPLIAGWNTWVLGRSTIDEPQTEDLARYAKVALKYWFGGSGIFRPNEIDHVDAAPMGLRAQAAPNNVDGQPVIASVTQCPSNFSAGWREDWDGNRPYTLVMVRFVYRGRSPNMPWPAARSSRPQYLGTSAFGAQWCPADADWLLVAAYGAPEPDRLPVPGRPKKGFDISDPFGVVEAAKGAKETVEKVERGIMWPIAITAGAVAAIVIVPRLLPSRSG